MALKFKTPAVLLALALAGSIMVPLAQAEEEQPHMRAALEHLKAAQAELAKAEHDKGGHRAKAQQLTTQAIQQVEQGMRYDEKHESKREEKHEHDKH